MELTDDLSEEENEMNLINRRRFRPNPKILDSDSEGDTDSVREAKPKQSAIIDSDSDEDAARSENITQAAPASDSEHSECEVTPHNKSFPDEEGAVEAVIYTTNSKGELVPEDAAPKSIQKPSLAALCDSESSDEGVDDTPVTGLSDDEAVQPVIYKPKKRQPKMTAKDAAIQRTEIQSESQRMVRESNVSLPYHRPKSYTIKEFLKKRSKLTSALPLINKAPPSVAIKMSKDQLVEVSKKLNERIKEVQKFYKSDSEDEEETREREETTQEVRGWLEALLDNAMDLAEPPPAPEEEENEYDFNLDDIDETEPSKILKLAGNVLDVQPKLSGCPDDIIDLESGTRKPSDVRKLVEKFLQHTMKKPQKHKVHVDILEVGGRGEILKETLSMEVDEEEPPAMVETPGAKLQKLRDELQQQMAQKRLELWKQKNEQGDRIVIEKKADEEVEKDILDDEEEYELTESEESEEEEDEEDEIVSEKSEKKSEFIDNEADEDDEEEVEDEADEADDDASEPEIPQKKTLKRISKAFVEDSDEEEEPKTITDALSDDDIISPNLPRVNITPNRPQLQREKSEFDFLTPVTYLTGLQNLDSESRLSKVSPTSPFAQLSEPSPLKESSSQKRLFEENSNPSQNIDELLELCSGQFPETQENVEETSTQDLLDVCSGDFTTGQGGTSGEQLVTIKPQEDKEIKHLEDDPIISQLLDEAEVERFKKKFESPVTAPAVRESEEVNATGLIDSDDENEELGVRAKKKRKKLVFSDDEDSDDVEEAADEEEIDLHDEDDEEVLMEKQLESEESGGFKLTDFLEKEAELSGSEWDSADEDEEQLDFLEVEQGDEEKFNENKLRSELERLHMRKILDDDQRDVKLLQELLLEDGEMHGSGRKRQFRWKALDSQNNGEFDRRDDDDIFMDEEEESEEQFRKMRHKREMFLKKKSTDDDVDSILSDSQILMTGKQIFKTSQSSGSASNTPVDKTDSTKEPFSLLSKRGSFLSRGDKVLQRLAEYNKVNNAIASTVKNNSRAFIFQTVESSETLIVKQTSKRKATDGTPAAIKKLRLDIMSPAAKKKGGGSKKLFSSNN